MAKLLLQSLILLTIIFLTLSCNQNDFRIVCIGFNLEHPDFKVIPPVFDTLTETVLVKEAYNEGAIFETVTEQVLTKEEHTSIKILDIQYINILADVEEDFICAVPCIKYFAEDDFLYTTIENNYTTRTYQRVAQNGTGDFVQAEYTDREYYRLITDAKVQEGGSNLLEELQKTLNLPDTTTFENHWKRQLLEQNATDCGDSLSYRVIY